MRHFIVARIGQPIGCCLSLWNTIPPVLIIRLVRFWSPNGWFSLTGRPYFSSRLSSINWYLLLTQHQRIGDAFPFSSYHRHIRHHNYDRQMDSIVPCFLLTGTGKILIAAMGISATWHENAICSVVESAIKMKYALLLKGCKEWDRASSIDRFVKQIHRYLKSQQRFGVSFWLFHLPRQAVLLMSWYRNRHPIVPATMCCIVATAITLLFCRNERRAANRIWACCTGMQLITVTAMAALHRQPDASAWWLTKAAVALASP